MPKAKHYAIPHSTHTRMCRIISIAIAPTPVFIYGQHVWHDMTEKWIRKKEITFFSSLTLIFSLSLHTPMQTLPTSPQRTAFLSLFSRKQIPQHSALLHPIHVWLLWLKGQAFRGCELVWLLAAVKRLLTCVLGRMCVRSSAGSCFSDRSNWSLATAMDFNAKHTDTTLAC